MLTCDYCGIKTKYRANLQRHIKSVHLKTMHKYKCPHADTCSDMIYTTKESLNIHLYRVHDVAAPVTCSSCQLGFNYVSELKIHRRKCGGSGRKKPRTRKKNIETFCEVTPDGFRCKLCQKVFVKEQTWISHYAEYHRDTNICRFCNKQMSAASNLSRHIRTKHNNIKRFQCDVCKKSFGEKHSLESHINTHTGAKPFSCNLCSFRSESE